MEQLRVYADKTIAGVYVVFNLPSDMLYKHMSKQMPGIQKKDALPFLGCCTDENLNTVSFEDFKYLVNKNVITQKYKGTVSFDVPLLGDYNLEVDLKVPNDDFIKIIEDVFCNLNDKPTTIRKCLNTLCEFLQAPKEKKEIYRSKLHAAYLNVPKSKQTEIYPLTIDIEGKTPIEDILYKRKSRLDNYDDFVKVYDDGYFEEKYRKK